MSTLQSSKCKCKLDVSVNYKDHLMVCPSENNYNINTRSGALDSSRSLSGKRNSFILTENTSMDSTRRITRHSSFHISSTELKNIDLCKSDKYNVVRKTRLQMSIDNSRVTEDDKSKLNGVNGTVNDSFAAHKTRRQHSLLRVPIEADLLKKEESNIANDGKLKILRRKSIIKEKNSDKLPKVIEDILNKDEKNGKIRRLRAVSIRETNLEKTMLKEVKVNENEVQKTVECNISDSVGKCKTRRQRSLLRVSTTDIILTDDSSKENKHGRRGQKSSRNKNDDIGNDVNVEEIISLVSVDSAIKTRRQHSLIGLAIISSNYDIKHNKERRKSITNSGHTLTDILAPGIIEFGGAGGKYKTRRQKSLVNNEEASADVLVEEVGRNIDNYKVTGTAESNEMEENSIDKNATVGESVPHIITDNVSIDGDLRYQTRRQKSFVKNEEVNVDVLVEEAGSNIDNCKEMVTKEGKEVEENSAKMDENLTDISVDNGIKNGHVRYTTRRQQSLQRVDLKRKREPKQSMTPEDVTVDNICEATDVIGGFTRRLRRHNSLFIDPTDKTANNHISLAFNSRKRRKLHLLAIAPENDGDNLTTTVLEIVENADKNDAHIGQDTQDIVNVEIVPVKEHEVKDIEDGEKVLTEINGCDYLSTEQFQETEETHTHENISYNGQLSPKIATELEEFAVNISNDQDLTKKTDEEMNSEGNVSNCEALSLGMDKEIGEWESNEDLIQEVVSEIEEIQTNDNRNGMTQSFIMSDERIENVNVKIDSVVQDLREIINGGNCDRNEGRRDNLSSNVANEIEIIDSNITPVFVNNLSGDLVQTIDKNNDVNTLSSARDNSETNVTIETMPDQLACQQSMSKITVFRKGSKSLNDLPAIKSHCVNRPSLNIDDTVLGPMCLGDGSCRYVAKHLTDLKMHMEQLHSNKLDNTRTESNRTDETDRANKPSNSSFNCKLCTQSFDSLSQLQTHNLLHNLDFAAMNPKSPSTSENRTEDIISSEETTESEEISFIAPKRKRSKPNNDSRRGSIEPRANKCKRVNGGGGGGGGVNRRMRSVNKDTTEKEEAGSGTASNSTVTNGSDGKYVCLRCPEKPCFFDRECYLVHVMSKCRQVKEIQEKLIKQYFPSQYGCGTCGLMFKTITRMVSHKEVVHKYKPARPINLL